MGKWLLLTGVVCLLFTGPAAAQVAQPHLVSKGNLTLAPGNPSEIEGGTIRPYVGYFTQDGTTEWTDDTSADFTTDAYYGAVDLKVSSVTFSLGYQSIHDELESDLETDIVTIETEADVTVPALQVSGSMSDRGKWGISVLLPTSEHTINGEIDGEKFSGSAKNSYVDVKLGATYQIADRFWLGAQFSPQVADKADFDGDLSELESIEGHGSEWTVGVGWLPLDAVAIGLDYSLEQEDEESESPGGWAMSLTADVKLAESVYLSPEIDYSESEKLAVDGEPSVSPRRDVALGGTVYWIASPARNLVLGLSAFRTAQEGSDYGDAEFDEDRFDRLDAMTYEISLSMVF